LYYFIDHMGFISRNEPSKDLDMAYYFREIYFGR